jgi:hypothetical protein
MSNKTPFKIIYKYRNSNRKFQYFYYIFLGNIPANIKRIISKFTDYNYLYQYPNFRMFNKSNQYLCMDYYKQNLKIHQGILYRFLGNVTHVSAIVSANANLHFLELDVNKPCQSQ